MRRRIIPVLLVLFSLTLSVFSYAQFDVSASEINSNWQDAILYTDAYSPMPCYQDVKSISYYIPENYEPTSEEGFHYIFSRLNIDGSKTTLFEGYSQERLITYSENGAYLPSSQYYIDYDLCNAVTGSKYQALDSCLVANSFEQREIGAAAVIFQLSEFNDDSIPLFTDVSEMYLTLRYYEGMVRYEISSEDNIIYTSEYEYVVDMTHQITITSDIADSLVHGNFLSGNYKISFFDYQDELILETDFIVVNTYQNAHPTNTPTPTAMPGKQGFIERLYLNTLNRHPSMDEVDFWVNSLEQSITGGDVAKEFFNSPEFLDTNISDIAYVIRLYDVFMNRQADPGGLNYWMSFLSSGGTRDDVLSSFINSNEWVDICENYGITPGNINASSGTVNFVKRIYTIGLNRDADNDGLKYWSEILSSGDIKASDVARTFFFSDELLEAELSSEEFVARLYLVFMDRNPEDDSEGFSYWVELIDNGMSREEVFESFSNADEFIQICSSYGIRN